MRATNEITALVLAAGKGTRMKLAQPKVLIEVAGRPLAFWLLKEVFSLKKIIKDVVMVLGYKGNVVQDEVAKEFKKVKFCYQKKLDGTAKAVGAARHLLKTQYVLILCGDAPLVRRDTLVNFIKFFFKEKCDCAFITAFINGETDLGRVFRNSEGRIKKIVEKIDLQFNSCEVNSGMYLFRKDFLIKGLGAIRPNKKKKEFFLTDIIEVLYRSGCKISSYPTDFQEIMAVNTIFDYAQARRMINQRLLQSLAEQGVVIVDPETTFVSFDTKIGGESIIYPFTFIEKDVIIGGHCKIGPFTHLRPNTVIEDNTSVGNFTEIVRSRLGKKVKMKHFSYLGDTSIAEDVNIGAGCVTANYDGSKKHKTIIEKGAFIGSDTVIVAPARVGKGAVTGAGSVVKKGVKKNTIVVGVPAKPIRRKK